MKNLGDVEAIQRAIGLTLYYAPTDEQPQHCPDAPETWCKWKKKETGDQSCENFIHKKEKTAPKATKDKLVPTFQHLSDLNFPERCKDGGAWNQSEALHGLT